MARLLNDGIAEAERKHPTRFRGCIHLPIHEPEAAKRELRARGINELGLRAVALLACHLDVQLDNPTMNPLYEVIQKHHLPIVIHPQFEAHRFKIRFTTWIAACSGPLRRPRPSCA